VAHHVRESVRAVYESEATGRGHGPQQCASPHLVSSASFVCGELDEHTTGTQDPIDSLRDFRSWWAVAGLKVAEVGLADGCAVGEGGQGQAGCLAHDTQRVPETFHHGVAFHEGCRRIEDV
jgi:hypothetical protein